MTTRRKSRAPAAADPRAKTDERGRGSGAPLSVLSSVNVLPVQFFAENHVPASGERRLLLAVLERAISDLCNSHASQGSHRDREEARRWVESRDDSSPYSFVRVCEALGLAPDALRSGILSLEREESLRSPAAGRPRATRWRRRTPEKPQPKGKRA